jgi:hypothetical protein
VATLLDGQVGIIKETTYGTPPVVTRFHEVLPDSTHDFTPEPLMGAGLRVGGWLPRTARRTAGVGKGEITLKVEVFSKGMGVLLEAISGVIEHTLVAGSTYQQRGRPALSTPVRPSYAIQIGVPRGDAVGTVDAYTYAGCVAAAFELDAPARGVPTLSVTFWAASLATGTALATASYPSAPTLFGDGAGTAGATFGGALTVPTTTALESGGTVASSIRGWTLSADLMPNERPKLGGWQQPTAGGSPTTLKIVQDYDATVTRALQISQATTSFTGFYTGAALSTGVERFGIVVPAMQLDGDSFGQLTNGEGSIPEPTFTVGENGTDAGWYLITRTSDTAL